MVRTGLNRDFSVEARAQVRSKEYSFRLTVRRQDYCCPHHRVTAAHHELKGRPLFSKLAMN
jgi:hypothetical protein